MQFHILSFEGPDGYSRAGGLASRVDGLSRTLAELGFETHLWFVGDPELPGHEHQGNLHLRRWCQWVSRHHPDGVYQGEVGKQAEYAASLPPFLLDVMAPHLARGGRAVVLAEEWQTADAVLHLHWLLRHAGLRERVTMLWNANNTYGFDRVPWQQLQQAAGITTVSRYMKHQMARLGVEAQVIPNGLSGDAFHPPDRPAVAALRRRFRDRTVLTKMARWDPDKRWLASVDLVAELKRQDWKPLLLARGGSEPHGEDVLRAAHERGLRVVERRWENTGPRGLVDSLRDLPAEADVVNLRSHVDSEARRALFRSADAVLANSGHEPFGLVGLETMAAGGVACTGCSGEDYAQPGLNALVLETAEPQEFIALFALLRRNPGAIEAMRRAGRATARRYSWPSVLERVLLPRVDLHAARRRLLWAGESEVGVGRAAG